MVYLLILVVLVIAGVVLVRRRSASPELASARQEVSARRKAFKEAEKARANAARAPEKQLKQVTKAHEKAVANAESQLRQLNDPKGRLTGSYNGVRLYERWIDTPHGSGPVEGTVASVDSQVSSRITATRLLTIGVFALAAKRRRAPST